MRSGSDDDAMGGSRDIAKLEVDNGRGAISALSTNTLGVGGSVFESGGLDGGDSRSLGAIGSTCTTAFGRMRGEIQRIIFKIR